MATIAGTTTDATQYACSGENTSSTGSGGAGVYGYSGNASIAGVYGYNAGGNAVQGNTSTGKAVYGQGGTATGVYGDSTTGTAVHGVSTGGTAVSGSTSAATGYGVVGFNTSTTGSGGAGVYGNSSNPSVAGVYGVNTDGGYAIYGNNNSGDGIGVYGFSTSNQGVRGVAALTGVSGLATGPSASPVYGVAGYAGTSAPANSAGIYGSNNATAGLYAGYFDGPVDVIGTLTANVVSKGSGTFLIDHPLEPTTKDLQHSFVESPDMKNIYDGQGVADANGELSVQMPKYFEALNKDFRYQLTPIGEAAPNLHIKSELVEGCFVIAGATPGRKLCWQLTGTRKDAFALAHPVEVEREKSADQKGFYRYPLEHGQPESMGIEFQKRERTRLLEAERTASTVIAEVEEGHRLPQ
jgi:hypothetical protein